MKKNIVFLILIHLFLASCNNEDISKITMIEVKSSVAEVLVGNNFVFSVVANNGENVTSNATFKVNGNAISGNEYTAVTSGDYSVEAVFEDFQSQLLTVRAVNPSIYSQKVLIEDYTGAWCGFCPRIAYSIERVKEMSDKVVSVAVHLYENNDPYSFEGSQTLNDEFSVGGLPEGRLNRMTRWQSPEPNNLDQPINLTGLSAPLGLAINSAYEGNSINATVIVGFDQTFTNELGIVVYLVENGLIYDQTNYTNLFPVGTYVDPLVGFEHNDVLRAIYTSHLGETIPSTSTTEDSFYNLDLEVDIPVSVENNENLHLVAFVVDKTTNVVLNVQETALGENKPFD